jgi:ribosomal-protein-alanine N-acetyltransferase
VVVAVTRLIPVNDAPVLSELLRHNRAFLAPWQPLRPDGFYTLNGQQESVAQALRQHEAANSRPLVIVDDRAEVVGTITLQSIIRGAFQSCSVGYWLAETAQGQGSPPRRYAKQLVASPSTISTSTASRLKR